MYHKKKPRNTTTTTTSAGGRKDPQSMEGVGLWNGEENDDDGDAMRRTREVEYDALYEIELHVIVYTIPVSFSTLFYQSLCFQS